MSPAAQRYIAPARGAAQLWRLLLGLALILAVTLLWAVPGLWLAERLSPEAGFVPAPGGQGSDTPAGLLRLLFAFPGLALGVLLVAALVHRRGPGSLFGPWSRLAGDFLAASGLVLAVSVLALVALVPLVPVRPGIDLSLWLRLLPLALPVILLQTLAEELLFRAYLPQQLAARFAAPVMRTFVPALLFTLLHLPGQPVSAQTLAGLALIFLLSLLLADLTWHSGGLGLAWGVHFANNCIALLLFSVQADLSGLALWTASEGLDPRLFAGLALADALLLLACYGLLRRRALRQIPASAAADAGV